mmetsp:Transcript_86802/g.140738  ORF Transcript_86802/g.140738 Transcript_86802/m.140738 type:complete len:741 (-) Transcript_86802:404-2626(-)|eukprot:CAMPEP_0179434068 /NCGR_PEP_ID=MMETSP0799-20121207/18381_1 /TAXON_ID=46947 /ORGANISM="Geminigera cryophila, Strain CCMP2564" /LENGTH=740 /DNA_ID=CAMNT_0021212475 /DNA_START=117 /DNA_END=2339 /DNA_ORIENTATION=-
MAKALPSLGRMQTEGPDQTMGIGAAPAFNLHKHEKRGLPHFFTEEAMFASRRLTQLVSVVPEHSMERQGLLIDTDPRHVGHAPLDTLELPGVTGRPSSGQAKMKGKKKKEQSDKPAVSYASDAQIVAEEAAQQERILYEMRQNLQKLKEYGKEIGFSFDISKKKSQFGRMQGEKWQDEEMEVWKKQAQRLLSTPEPANKKLMREEPKLDKMGVYVFHLEKMLNDFKFFRQRKQIAKDTLQNEFEVAEAQESREQSGAGKMADMYGRVSKTKERIQNTDQKILTESELCKEFTLEHEIEVAACQEIRDKVEETAKQLKNYQHDTELIKLQLKDKMHDVEKILQQGKLVTMGEVKSEIKSRYKGELDMRNKVIHKQKQVKEMIAAHEQRVQELTVQLQKQYDPNLDSPRRNELKRKAAAFEEVFDTMMKRIGESDITRIVEMFQKQSLTHQAWTEAVRDQEIRVKALQDEKKTLDKQLHKVSSNKQHGIANETRQYTISGRRLDMASERSDNASIRLMQLEGLIAHVKESMRQALVRLQEYNEDVAVPPSVFPDEGEGGLIDVVGSFTEAVVQLKPDQSKYDELLEAVKSLDTYTEPPPPAQMSLVSSPGAKKRDGDVDELIATMPRALKLAITKAADDLESSKFVNDEDFFAEGNMNRRIPFPLPRDKQKQIAQQEAEQDEADARADSRDIISRDELKRNAWKVQKTKEREKAEAEARDRGEESPVKKTKKKPRKAPSSPG